MCERREEGNLILDGVPPLTPNMALEQFKNTRQAHLKGWHLGEDGRPAGLLLTTRFADTSQVHYVKTTGAARKQLTFADEPIASVEVCPNVKSSYRDTFLFLKDVGGNEDYQIHHYDLNTGKAVLLSDGKHKHGSLLWSESGEYFVYHSNELNGKDLQVHLYDLKSHTSRLLFNEPGVWFNCVFFDDDKKLVVLKYISSSHKELYQVDVGTGELVRLNETPEPVSYGALVYSKVAHGFFFTSDEASDFTILRFFDIATQKVSHEVTRHIPWAVDDVAVSLSGRTIAFTVNADGIDQLHILDASLPENAPELVSFVPQGLITGLRFHSGEDKISFTVSYAQTAGDCYVADLASKAVERWTESEVGGLDTSSFIVPILFRYKSFDDLEIPAFYYRAPVPKGEATPVIIYIHGGPASQFRPSFIAKFQYYLLERKISVIAPNVRGSTGYGRKYMEADDCYKREDSVKDIGALLDWIAANKELDSTRVFLDGGSYGGYMVLASLVHYGSHILAAMERVGISNFVTFLESTGEYRRDLRRKEYGDESDPEMRAFLEKISPLTNVDKINKPLLVTAGQNDPRVPVGESIQIIEKVREKGCLAQLVIGKNEGHGFAKKANVDRYLDIEAAFVDAVLNSVK